jgi:hypothetical protein
MWFGNMLLRPGSRWMVVGVLPGEVTTRLASGRRRRSRHCGSARFLPFAAKGPDNKARRGRGTEGSNPSPSSGESVASLDVPRSGTQRQYDVAATTPAAEPCVQAKTETRECRECFSPTLPWRRADPSCERMAVPGDIPPSANADRTAQASTRSGTISLPLVSGPRKRARHQLPPPIMQPTSIGIENPSW